MHYRALQSAPPQQNNTQGSKQSALKGQRTGMTSRSTTVTGSPQGRLGPRPGAPRSKGSDSSTYMHSRSTTAVMPMKVSNPVQLQYVHEEPMVTFPKKILFRDYLCRIPLQTIDLKGWTVSNHIFEVIQHDCPDIRVLHLDDVNGLTPQCFETIRGLKQLRSLSLQRVTNCPITLEIAHCIASFKSLKYLNLNDCQASTEVFEALSQSCANLRTLHVARCKGLDAFGLHAIAQWIQRHRRLQVLDFSGCDEITDDGVLDVFVAGYNILVEVDLSHCRGLSTTALTGVRTKMPEFRKLNISHMVVGHTLYDWLTEGCRSLTHLNVANSPDLDDPSLSRIGRWCKHLLSINISQCLGITDNGVTGFFKQFYGALEAVDMSNCVNLGSESAVALSCHAGALKELKLNGLSRMEPPSLTLLWGAATSLVHFEMCNNLSTATTHRKSSMPHFSDRVITMAESTPSETLRTLKLTGAFKVTDTGACALARACTGLVHIDVSYCNGIGDALLIELAACATQLKGLAATGCIAVTSAGVTALSQGCCRDTLEQLEINGCSKVMDPGLFAIAEGLTNLQVLGIRGCDHATDAPIIAIATACRKLHSVDMLNLDYVSAEVLRAFAEHCPHLTVLNSEGCNFTAREYVAALQKKLPYATPVGSKCRLFQLPRPVVNFNKYVMEVKSHDRYARVLQRFGRFIVSTRLLRIARKLKRQEATNMKRIFAAFRLGVERSKKEGLRVKHHYAAIDLQRGMRRVYAVHLARLRARRLRRERDARLLLQRVIRGFMSRKRTTATFTRLYIFYNRIGHIVHKYLVLREARRTHRHIVCAQAFARMVGPLVRYRLMHWAISTLQIRWKHYVRRHAEILHRQQLERERLRLEAIRRDQAARLLQRNWKNTFFNKCMAPFILTACVYFRVNYDDQKWHSTMIQRRWRGYIVRLKLCRKTSTERKRYNAAVAIQALVRGRIQRKRFFRLRKRMRKVNKCYRTLLVNSRPRLRIGRVVKVLQKYVRRFLFVMRRYYAAITLQCVYRGYRGRRKWTMLIFLVHTKKVNKIKRAFHIYKCRKMRKEIIARRHMAAYKIWAKVDKLFGPKRAQQALARARHEEWERNEAEKRSLLTQKRTRTVTRIKGRYHDLMASRIQHAYRGYKQRKTARLPTPTKIRRDVSIATKAAAAKKVNRADMLLAPVRAARKLMHAIPNPFGNIDLVPEKEMSKIMNSILKYQVKNILQEGLIELHLTVGEMELKNFQNTQNSIMRNQGSYFTKIDVDLSGDLYLMIFLWTKFGSGEGCICQLELQQKPGGTSLAGQKLRVHNHMAHGVKIFWHKHLQWELHGICSVMQGKGDFAIQAVRVAASPQDVEALEADGGFTMAGDLAKNGMHTSIWTTARKPVDEANLYKFVQLATHPWFDERLQRVCKSVHLSEEDVLKMREFYDEVIAGRRIEVVRASEVFKKMDYPYTQLAQWVVQAVKPESTFELPFSEYVHMVAYFVMLASKELMKFLFHAADTDGKYYLTEEQFCHLIDVIGEGSPFNPRAWQMQYKQYYDRRLGYLFIANFEEFLKKNPAALWQAQALQRKFMQFNIGIAYWEKKMEQFRVIREELGVKLL